MSTISLRLPDSLHKRVRELAKRENVSINQFISTALAEKLSALLTVDYLEERARRGRRADFERVLGKVRDVEPDEGDTLGSRRTTVREPSGSPGGVLPPARYRTFVERLTDEDVAGKKLRVWTGNDRNARAHHGKVPLAEDPLYLELFWKQGPGARRRPVGVFRIRLAKLLRSDHVRLDDDDTVRLRFYHGRDGLIYVQRRLDRPGIPIGRT